MADPGKFAISKLGNSNYASWKFQIEMFLIREDLWHVVADVKPEPVTDAWVKADRKARATLGLCIEESQYVLIKDCVSAKAVWDALKAYHEKSTASSQLALLNRLCDAKLSESGNVEKHLLDLDSLFERLVNAGLQLDEKLKIAMVLRSMPESYHFLASALEARPDADVTMQLVRSKLMDEYHKRQERSGKSASGEQVLKTQNINKDKVCFYCKQPGHFKADCRKWHSAKEKNSGAGPSGGMPGSSRQQTAKAKQVKNPYNNSVCFTANVEGEAICAAAKADRLWTVDSGASCHMTSSAKFFEKLEKSCVTVVMADGNCSKSGGVGNGALKGVDGTGDPVEIKLEKVLFVPNLDGGLLSVSKMADKGYSVLFTKNSVEVRDESESIVALGERRGGLYVLSEPETVAVAATQCHTVNCQHTWHRRFGHRDPAVFEKIEKEKLATGMKLVNCGAKIPCEPCMEGKMARLPYPQQAERKTTMPLQLIHTDVCGPMSNETPGGKRYFLTLIDDFSRYVVMYLLRDKSEAKQCIVSFVRMVENKFGRKPQVIRSDRGGEFVNHALEKFYQEEGIQMQLTAGYAPQQNGVAERRNRYLQEMAVCMLLDAGLEKKYWGEAIAAAAFIQNRLPSRSVTKTPMELWCGEKPDLSHLKVFGCEAFVYIPDAKRVKLDSRAVKLIFVGYACGSKAYRFLDKRTNKIVISRDARFLELGSQVQEESGREEKQMSSAVGKRPPVKKQAVLEESLAEPVPIELGSVDDGSINEEPDEDLPEEDSGSEDNASVEEEQESEVISEEDIDDDNDFFDTSEVLEEDQAELGRPQRQNAGVLPSKYQDYLVGVAKLDEPDPKNFREAVNSVQSDEWVKAMDDEYQSLLTKGTWSLVPLPKGRQAIGSKWVFKKKKDSSGQVVRHKARLVAQGFAQRYGKDFGEVFAPVAMSSTFRVLLALAGQRKLQVHHIDVKNAYLNGTLSEEIFMRQPPGYAVPGKEELVCKLHRSLYGLKQAARVWNATVKEVLLSLDFRQSDSDACLFLKQLDNGEWMYLLIYVDDIVLVCGDERQMDRLEQQLRKHFEISSLGPINQFLGIKVEKSSDGFYALSQKAFIKEIAERYGLDGAKTSKYPLDVGYMKQAEGEPLPDNVQYHSLVGALLYVATNTRPDIAVAVSILSRSTSRPTQRDWVELKRVVRYLIGTEDLVLQLGLKQEDGLKLIGYSDADWAGDTSDRKSTSGFVFMLGGAAVSWGSRKQNCVTMSTMEAEYVALSEAAQEAVWLRRLLCELDEEQPLPTKINEDNRSCIDFVSLERQNKRSKHIDTRLHHAKDLCTNGFIQLDYCPTDRMVADIFTKPLGPQKMKQFTADLGLTMLTRGKHVQ